MLAAYGPGGAQGMERQGREVRLVRAVEDSLAHYSIEGDNVEASLQALHELLDTDKVLLYSLAQRPKSEDLAVVRDATVGFAPSWRDVFDEYLTGRGIEWCGYNAVHPDPSQRDLVLDSDEIRVLTDGQSLVAENILCKGLGVFGHKMMRVLVCEGPSLLGWLGCFQPDATTERQRELMTRLLPAFRRRLEFDRFVTEAKLASSALIAALEQVNGAAYVLGSAGRISHANAAGRARFDHDPDATQNALAACVAGAPTPRFKVAPLRGSAGSAGHIIVEMPEPAGGPEGLADSARRFGLTPAQTRVLERVARGISNATIAAELGVAERTVEAHVTAILIKAQVPSRAALIVQVFQHRRSA